MRVLSLNYQLGELRMVFERGLCHHLFSHWTVIYVSFLHEAFLLASDCNLF